MNAVKFSDAQLDEAASRYAVVNRVSYSEALSAVVSMAQFAEPAATPPASGGADDELTDSRIHFEAMAYHLTKKVSYAEALRAVVDSHRANWARGAAVQANFSDDSDKQLHARAVAFSESNGVSYSEALNAVAPVQMTTAASGQQANFSDDSDTRLLHQEAQAFATANGVNYSEALFSVSAGRPKTQAQQTLETQPIEIFRAGTHIDTVGVSRVYTVEDVKAMAAAYEPTIHEAPLTIGHPEDSAPAQGWASGLKATDDGVLLMQTRKVDPVFADDVKAGRFLKRSASFYPPHAANNPVPGTWYLRHVAWLGATAPAVKRLADVNFSAAADAVCFAF